MTKINLNHDFLTFILDQLDNPPDVTTKRMFGAYGIYWGDKFFAILHQGKLYFKTNANSRGDYELLGMEPFRPNEKQTLKNYYQVPVEIIEDREQLLRWAKTAVEVN